MHEQEERITQICRSRRAPWSFTIEDGFVWTGDEEIEALAIIPALTALADARFAGGVKAEFESARQELSVGFDDPRVSPSNNPARLSRAR